MTPTKQREVITQGEMDKLIELLNANGYEVTRTKDFQTLTFDPCKEVVNSDKTKYLPFASIKFTLHKEDFDMVDAENEYKEKVVAKEVKAKEAEKKRADALAKREKAKADKAAKSKE